MLKNIGHGSIRKIKGGAAGVIALSTIFLGATAVSANEADVEAKSEVGVSTKVEEKGTEVKPTAPEVVKETEKTKQDSQKQEEKAENTKAEAKNDEVVKEVPKETSTESFKKAESKEFDIAKADAKENGVSVKEDAKPAIKNSDAEAQQDLAKQTKDLKKAQKTQVGSDAIVGLNKEKLNEAGIKVVDGKVKVFTDLKEMENFVKQQSKDIADDIETKHNIDKDVQLQTEELKQAGIEVVVGKEVVKSSPKEAIKALEDLQQQVKTAVKTKQELDSAFLALQERAKTAGLLTKDGKGITFESAKDAKEFMAKQVEEVKTLIEALEKENSKLIGAIANAESYGIKVSKGSALKVADTKEATNTVSTQVAKFNTLVDSIKESKSLISTVVNNAKKSGVVLEGETIVNVAKGEETKLNEKVSSALNELKEATKAQNTAKEQLTALIAEAKAKGINVNISGNKKVSYDGVSAELSSIKDKISKALAEKEKADADYTTALKNATESSRLMNGSTATKDGDVYKQSLTIKSGGTKGSVSLKATGSADILSVELIDPSGKKVESVKTLADLTSYTDFGKEGNYTLNYTFRAKDLTSGSVVSSANTQGIAAVEGKEKGTFSLTTKAPVSTNVTNEYKPTVLDVVLDFSSSYRYKIFDSIDQAKMLINEALTNKDSKVIIQAYTYNSEDTYAVKKNGTGSNGYSTTLLTKEEALKILDELKVLVGKNPSISDKYFPSNFEGYFAAIEKTFGDKNYVLKNADAVVPFEDVVKEVTKPTDLVSVIQFTDGWSGGEEVRGVTTPLENIDTSFAEWAKGRAKTFMSVVNKNITKASEGEYDKDTNSEQSIKDMQRVGHPNIYDMTGKDRSVVDKELLAKFKETAIEKVTSTKGEDQTVAISIVGTNTAKVTKATLKGAKNKDLPIKDGKVNFTEKLPDGSWTVEYELSGNGQVTVTATVAGKEVVKETKNLKEVKGVEGSNTSKTDNLNAVVLPKAPEVKPLTVEDITVVAKDVRLGTIESDATTVTVEKELNKATFKETVTPISFERTVTPAQAEVTTHDVYVKSAKTLPNTGTADSSMTEVAGAGLGLVGLLSLYGLKRKED